eukprot:7110334-Pyramimonas_sp.AAC.1
MHLIGPPCAGGSAPGLPHPGEGGGPLGAASGVPPCGDALPSGQEPKRESSDSSAKPRPVTSSTSMTTQLGKVAPPNIDCRSAFLNRAVSVDPSEPGGQTCTTVRSRDNQSSTIDQLVALLFPTGSYVECSARALDLFFTPPSERTTGGLCVMN